MATTLSKINPLHFGDLTTDFTKNNSLVAHECERDSAMWYQVWSDGDTIRLQFFDDDAFGSAVRLVDYNSGVPETHILPSAMSGDEHWFEIPLAGYAGREMYVQIGLLVPLPDPFFVIDSSNVFKIYPDSSDLIQNCTTVWEYYGCSDDFGWFWNTTSIATVPTYVPYIRVLDSIRERPLVVQKTVKESFLKEYSLCNAEVDFLKVVRIEFSPPWWHELLGLVSLMKVFTVDGVLYIQEVEPQPGEQYQNLPLFKGELVLRKAEQGATVYRYNCC